MKLNTYKIYTNGVSLNISKKCYLVGSHVLSSRLLQLHCLKVQADTVPKGNTH